MKKKRGHNIDTNTFFRNNPDEKETYAKDFIGKAEERKGGQGDGQ